MNSKTFSYHNTHIHYRIYGKGQPVLLLHGFGEDSRIFDFQIPRLASICQLIIPDLPGSGYSPFIAGVSNSMDAMADCMLQLLKQLDVGKTMVLGHSMGGYIAMAMLQAAPQSLAALGLVHSSAAADDEEKKSSRRKAIAFVEQNGAHAFLKTAIPNLFAEGWRKANSNSVQELVDRAEAFSNEAVIAYYEGMIARPDRNALLEDLQIPVLFMIGSEDAAVPMEKVLPQTHLPVISYVHILQACGHMGMLEMPDVTNDHMSRFITENIG